MRTRTINNGGIIDRETFLPIYEKIPKNKKQQLVKLLNFKTTSHFVKKRYLTALQFEYLQRYVDNNFLQSNNTVKEKIPFDFDYVSDYNKRLLSLINSEDFLKWESKYRNKIILEQMKKQSELNRT